MASSIIAGHDEMRDAMTRFATLIAETGVIDRNALLQARVSFSRLFATHFGDKQAQLRALATASPQSELLCRIRKHEQSLSELRADYSGHISRWTPDAIERNWPGYVKAVLALQGHFRALMAWEEENILPLAGAA